MPRSWNTLIEEEAVDFQHAGKRHGLASAKDLPSDPSRAYGFRAVTFAGLRKKAMDIVLAGEWREWDVAKLAATETKSAKSDASLGGRVR